MKIKLGPSGSQFELNEKITTFTSVPFKISQIIATTYKKPDTIGETLSKPCKEGQSKLPKKFRTRKLLKNWPKSLYQIKLSRQKD